MKILCNLPLECFEERANFNGIELRTFGPPGRMWVDGEFFPFDIEFDPSMGSVRDLWQRLDGFAPDVLLLWWPDQEPLPRDLHDCPARVVGVLSDYNLSLPAMAGLWPFFDVLLVDRPGVDLFTRLSFPDVRYFCQFTFKARTHGIHAECVRDIDVGFAGNLNKAVQPERAPWIERVRGLRQRGHRIEVTSGVFGADYGRFLSRTRIGFNRSVRGEANLRAFEVAACGACLFMERSNHEIRDFFVPGEECVLYGDDDFEDLIEQYLGDEPLRRRVAAAGHARVQHHRMRHRLAALQQVLAQPGPGRPNADAFARHLGRGIALMHTWAHPAASLPDLTAARRLCPSDPRPLAALALTFLRLDPTANARCALALLEACCALAPRFLPALRSLAWLHAELGTSVARPWRERLDSAAREVREFRDVDGLCAPMGYSEENVAIAGALATSIRTGGIGDELRTAWGRLELPTRN